MLIKQGWLITHWKLPVIGSNSLASLLMFFFSGGRVVSTRCTQPWPGSEAQSFDPRAAIRSGVAPGECWAFQGEGRLVLELSHEIRVTGFSIEHISGAVHPEGFTASAPREFSLFVSKSN